MNIDHLTVEDMDELERRFPDAAAFIRERELVGELSTLRRRQPYLTDWQEKRLEELETWANTRARIMAGE